MQRIVKPLTPNAIPIPALAPSERLLVGEEDGVAVLVGLEKGCVTMFDGCAVVDVLVLALVLVDVLVVNSEKSFCWTSTLIGCPHITTGPVIVVKFNPESSAPLRACTAVLPLLNVLRHPANKTVLVLNWSFWL